MQKRQATSAALPEPRKPGHVSDHRGRPADFCFEVAAVKRGSVGLVAGPATEQKPGPDSADFCFDPILRSEAARAQIELRVIEDFSPSEPRGCSVGARDTVRASAGGALGVLQGEQPL